MVRARSKIHHAFMNLNGEIPIELYGYCERSVALDILRNITGKNYGYDTKAWREWINENKPKALPSEDNQLNSHSCMEENDRRHPLEIAYQNYLEAELDGTAAENLIIALEQNDLTLESQALKTYLVEGSGAKCIVENWSNRSCTISLDPPINAEPGNLWFDPVELNLSVLIPNPEGISHHVKSLISTRSVRVWQYRAFLSLVKLGKKLDVFSVPDDYLNPRCFRKKDSLFCITGIYQDEALAYSTWMRKNLCGQIELNAAKAFLSSDEFISIFPLVLKLWESDDFQEWYRTAVGRQNLDKDPSSDYKNIVEENYDELESRTDRILYEEWDCRSNIGMLTIVPVFTGLGQENTSETLHYEILNRSPRPVLSTIS